jgi:hypothetical protein
MRTRLSFRLAARCIPAVALVAPSVACLAQADDAPAVVQRPALKSNRWQEDWSALADPALRTEPLDGLKYRALSDSDPQRYVSFGATLRERLESNDAAGFGTGSNRSDAYTIERLQLHADLHLATGLRVFTQLEDDRAWSKRSVGSADQDRVDLRLAFVEYDTTVPAGTLKTRIGRQDFAFDLQRFVSSRDGPNVRQSFDAVWADWETTNWRLFGFVSRPVQYVDDHAFDDRSNTDFRFDSVRIERHVLGDKELSAYWALFERADARYGDATGAERRQVLDARFAGAADAVDWDLEAMGQGGQVGAKTIRAWAFGARAGVTAPALPWRPRAGLQVDAASGDAQAGDGRVGTFNPLFPNGYYFALAGYTGDANLLHLKPSLTVRPAPDLSLMLAAGALWRQTTADSIYVQPNVAVPGTASHGARWTGAYGKLRADYTIDRHLACALEAVHYRAGETLRSVGGRDSSYVGIELKATW